MNAPALETIAIETAPGPVASIIWMHGLGADGEDFVPVAEQMPLPVAVRYVFPHAPMQPVTINGGYVMRAWYDIIATNIGAQQDEAGIRNSQAEIEKLIAQERERGVAAENIYLAGFSQGGAIALHTGIRHAERLGGIIALSTYLPLAQTLPQEASAACRELPIFMAHGSGDPIVPYELGRASADKLEGWGYPLDWHEYEMPHSVCMEEIGDLASWLGRQLGRS